MENVLKEILSKLDEDSLQAISKKANATPNQTKSALASAIPILMNALAKNSSSNEGAAALQKAVAKDHSGSLLDNFSDLLAVFTAAFTASSQLLGEEAIISMTFNTDITLLFRNE